jgi:adenine-specific DNA-methyltransferase
MDTTKRHKTAWCGNWTEQKLNAFEKYVNAYLTIMNKHRDKNRWKLICFDAFAGSGFRFFSLGEAVFESERRIKPDISFENLAAHIYFTETKTPINRNLRRKQKKKSPFLGIHDGTAYALLYNGVLGDKNVNGGNVLTHNILNYIKREIETCEKKNGGEFVYHQMVIYGEATRLTHVSRESNHIIFKQTPYDIKV